MTHPVLFGPDQENEKWTFRSRLSVLTFLVVSGCFCRRNGGISVPFHPPFERVGYFIFCHLDDNFEESNPVGRHFRFISRAFLKGAVIVGVLRFYPVVKVFKRLLF